VAINAVLRGTDTAGPLASEAKTKKKHFSRGFTWNNAIECGSGFSHWTEGPSLRSIMPVSTMSASSTHFARLRNAALTASLLASLFAAGCDSGGGSDKPRVPVTGTVEGTSPSQGPRFSFIEASGPRTRFPAAPRG